MPATVFHAPRHTRSPSSLPGYRNPNPGHGYGYASYCAFLGHGHDVTTSATVASNTTAAVAVGHHVVVVACVNVNATLSSVSDSVGLTWTVLATGVGGTVRGIGIAVAWAPSGLASGTTITGTFSLTTGTVKDISLHDIAGLLQQNDPSDGAGATQNNGTPRQASSTGTITTTQVDDMVFSATFWASNISNWTSPPGLSTVDTTSGAGGQTLLVGAGNPFAVLTNVDPTFWTSGSNSLSLGLTQAFKGAAPITGGPVTNFLTLTASSTPTVLFSQVPAKLAIITDTPTIVFARQGGKLLAASETATITSARRAGKQLAVSESATIGITRQGGKTLPITETAAPVLRRQSQKSLTMSETAAAVVQKQAQKLFAASETATVTMTRIKVATLLLTASSTAAAQLVRQAAKTLAASEAATVLVPRRAGKPLSASESATVATQNRAGKTLPASETATATLGRIKSVSLLLTAACTATVTIAKQGGKVLRRTTGIPSVVVSNRVGKSISASSVGGAVAVVVSSAAQIIRAILRSSPSASAGDHPTEATLQDSPTGRTGSNPSEGRFDS